MSQFIVTLFDPSFMTEAGKATFENKQEADEFARAKRMDGFTAIVRSVDEEGGKS